MIVDGPAASSALAALHTALSGAVRELARLAVGLPPPWAALLLGAGLLYLYAGGRRRLPLALPGGALLGLAAARWVAALKGAPSLPVEPAAVAAAVGGLGCAFFTPAFPPFALALPLAWLGANVWGGDAPWVAAGVSALAGVGLGTLLREWVASLAAGGIGAAVLLAGALGLLARQPLAAELRERPVALVALWAVLAVAGAAFHAGRAWKLPGAERRSGDAIRPADPAAPGSAADR